MVLFQHILGLQFQVPDVPFGGIIKVVIARVQPGLEPEISPLSILWSEQLPELIIHRIAHSIEHYIEDPLSEAFMRGDLESAPLVIGAKDGGLWYRQQEHQAHSPFPTLNCQV